MDVNGTNATPPYTSWATAATNIQDAVDAAVAGDEIVVTNGTYYPSSANSPFGNACVDVGKPLTLRSLNGPQLTIIDGGGGVRCVYLTNSATLSGFTLTNGSNVGEPGVFSGGAGVACESGNAVVSNCVITGNHVFGENGFPNADELVLQGGGAYGVTLNNCTLTNNSVDAFIVDIPLAARTIRAGGGGAAYCTLSNCALARNSVNVNNTVFGGSIVWHGYAEGGGALFCTLNNCTLSGNAARGTTTPSAVLESYGGGAASCTLNNCTLTHNSANWGGGTASFSTLNNCIVWLSGSIDGRYLNHCWTTDPLFVDTNGWANLRLQSNSPCINAGNNSYVTNATDLDGNPRIAGGTVDIGAYEFQSPVSMISYAWLQRYGLPINTTTDAADPDGDGVNNYREWLAGSDPTNPFSFPPLLTLIPYGPNVILTWPTNAVGFTLQSTTNLASPSAWVTDSPAPVVIGGQNVVINPVSGAQRFYRLKGN